MLILYGMRNKIFQIGLHVIVWITAFLLPYFVAYGEINMNTVFGKQSAIHLISTALLITYAYFNHYIFVPRIYLHSKYLAYATLVILGILVVIWFPKALVISGHHGPPHQSPPNSGTKGGPQPVDVFRLSYNIILFVICTFASISIRQQARLLEMQKEKLAAELSILKAEINPHFLFNTLNSIYALSIRKSDDAPKAIIHLSELMRYILRDSAADTVPLEKELSYISHYVALQKQRLRNTVQISYTVPTEIVTGQIAPLILMSFVENAFKHGVNPSQDSSINISISFKGKQLHLWVVNNKVTSIKQEETISIGLKNITSRLQHLYPRQYKLTIDDGEKYFSVNLLIDLND